MWFNRMTDIDKTSIECYKLQEFEHMWDRSPGRVRLAKHQRELTLLDIRPVNSAPYRAGQSAQEFKKTEIDKML